MLVRAPGIIRLNYHNDDAPTWQVRTDKRRYKPGGNWHVEYMLSTFNIWNVFLSFCASYMEGKERDVWSPKARDKLFVNTAENGVKRDPSERLDFRGVCMIEKVARCRGIMKACRRILIVTLEEWNRLIESAAGVNLRDVHTVSCLCRPPHSDHYARWGHCTC